MKSKICAPFLAAALIFFAASFGSAQSSSWSNVETIVSRTGLIVQTKTGTTYSGKVVSITPTTLNLTGGGRTITLERGDIAKVYRTKKSSRLKRAFIGAGIGAAVGIGIGVIYTRATKKGAGLAAASGFLYGIPIGAAVGGATGGKLHKAELIYEAI